MFDLLVEGFASLRFGCTVGFVLPLIGPAVAAGRRAWLGAAALIVLAGTVGWARFADRWFDTPSRAVLAVIAVVIVATAAASVFSAQREERMAGDASWLSRSASLGWILASFVLAALVAGWLWVPCVGEHFSEPLNNARTAPASTWTQVLAYVVGIAMPLAALAALPVAFPKLAAVRDSMVTRGAGVAFSALVGVSIAAGWYSELVVRFAP